MREIEFSISQLKNYQNLVESFLDQEKGKIASIIKSIEETSDLPEEENLWGMKYAYMEEYDDFTEHFQNTFRQSIIVQSYSFFEYHLKKICDRIFQDQNTLFQLNDLGGNSDLEKARIFIEKTCSIDIRKYNPEIDLIKSVQRLRNVIVHSRGEYQKQKHQELAKFIISQPSLTALETNDGRSVVNENDKSFKVLITDNQINLKFITSIESFFAKLTEEVFKDHN